MHEPGGLVHQVKQMTLNDMMEAACRAPSARQASGSYESHMEQVSCCLPGQHVTQMLSHYACLCITNRQHAFEPLKLGMAGF